MSGQSLNSGLTPDPHALPHMLNCISLYLLPKDVKHAGKRNDYTGAYTRSVLREFSVSDPDPVYRVSALAFGVSPAQK